MNRRLHLPLLFVSLAMAMAVKIGVHEGEQLSTQTLPVRVQNVVPPGFTVLQSVNEVQVQLRASTTAMAKLNPLTIHVDAEIPVDQEDRFVEILIEPEDVAVSNDFEVLSIQPNRFTVEFDREVAKRLPIQVEVTGEPAAGAQVGTRESRPPTLEVIGPASLVENLETLVVSVSVDRRAIAFEQEVTPLLPDPSVRFNGRSKVVVQVSFVQPELSSVDDALAQDAASEDEDGASRFGGSP